MVSMEDFQPQSVKGPDALPPQGQQVIAPQGPLAPTPPSSSGGFKNFMANNKWYVLAIALGLLIIGGLAAYAFWPRSEEPTEEANVQLDIVAPETTQAGGEVIYRVEILNKDSAKLVDMNLELVYDDGMTYVSSSPKPENISGTIFKVPELATGQNAVVIVKTLVQGNVNDEKRLVARLRYKFDNFNSGFTTETSHTTRLVAANVLLDFSGKTEVNNGEELTYELAYRNTSTREIPNGRIHITYPEGFSFASSNPSPSLGKDTWNINSLAPNASGKISFVGTMNSNRVGEGHVFLGEFLVPDESGNYFTQSSTTYEIKITAQALSVETKVTSGTAGIVKPGGSVNVDITFKNNSNTVNTGLQLVVEIESASVVSGSIKSESGYVQDQAVTWNGSSTPLLEQLNAGESGTVKLQFMIANPATTTETKNLTVKIKPQIKSNQNTQFITGLASELKISSPSSVATSVSHAGGVLPPKVAQETSFKVRIGLKNSSNDYRNGVLTASVPVGVNFDINSVTASERSLVKFDAATGRLTWEFGQLLAHSGTLRPERVLEFTVRTTPSASQAGKNIDLLRAIDITAVDDFTLENIKHTPSDLTSGDLPDSQDGRVQP